MVNYYGDMGESQPQHTQTKPEPRSSKILALFNFYWQKFLYKTRVIEREEEEIQKRLQELESEVKLKKMRNKIDSIS